MEALMAFNSKVNAFVWGPPMLILLVGTGIYLTFKQNWLQVTQFGYAMKNTVGRLTEKGEGEGGEVTPFQALATAMAATVGVGNIAGVATAIATGGPGAVFWMWLSAFLGCVPNIRKRCWLCITVMCCQMEPSSVGPLSISKKGLMLSGWRQLLPSWVQLQL